jgi:glycerol uptake facilitator-like aquaporin
VLIASGAGVVAQTVLSAGTNGSYLAINLGWGIAVTFGVLVAGGVSGAHLNPAVTVALALDREFSPSMPADVRARGYRGWRRAVERSLRWAVE